MRSICLGLLFAVLVCPAGGQNFQSLTDRKTLITTDLEARPGVSKAEAKLISEILRNGLVELSGFQLLETSRQEELALEKRFSGLLDDTPAKIAGPKVETSGDFFILGSLQANQDKVVLRLRMIDLKAEKAVYAKEEEFLKSKFFEQINSFNQRFYNDMITLVYGNNLESIETLAKARLFDEAWARLRFFLTVYPLTDRAQELRTRIAYGLAEVREEGLREALEEKDDSRFWELVNVILAYDEKDLLEDRILNAMEQWTVRDQQLFTLRMKEYLDRASKSQALVVEKELKDLLAAAPTSTQKTEIYETLDQVRLLVAQELQVQAYSAYYDEDLDQSAYYLGQSLEYNPEDPKSVALTALIADRRQVLEMERIARESEGGFFDVGLRPGNDLRLGVGVLALDDPEVRLNWKGTFPFFGAEYQQKSVLLPPFLSHWYLGIYGTSGSVAKTLGALSGDTQFLWSQLAGGIGLTLAFNKVEFQVQGGLIGGGAKIDSFGNSSLYGYLGLSEGVSGKLFLLKNAYIGLDLTWNQSWFFPVYGVGQFRLQLAGGMVF